MIYTRALDGHAGHQPDNLDSDLRPLFDTILEHLPPPQVEVDAPPRLLVTTLFGEQQQIEASISEIDFMSSSIILEMKS